MLRSFTGQLGSASQSTNPFFPVDCFAEGFGNVTAFYLLENINKFIEAYLPIFIPVPISSYFRGITCGKLIQAPRTGLEMMAVFMVTWWFLSRYISQVCLYFLGFTL